MEHAVVELTGRNWDAEVLEAQQPVLVDFWAPWCPPCHALAPLIDQVALEFAGRMKVVKLNVDEAPALAQRYDVRSIPSLLVFRDGRLVERHVGALSNSDLVHLLETQLHARPSPAR